ncbi:hypothetical protein ABMA27_014545 [Loxostege sticticalis]|uniref:Cathepsin propeptide inhibitor domain-containing protein n=1 Tax=Loxostege sticticalis TaxID=481309 RepID=A0ABR3I9E0_LOXSC
MKVIGVVLFICLLVNWIQAYVPYYNLPDAPYLFDKFIKDYHRHYKDYAEYIKRYSYFVENLIDINRLNAKRTNPDSATFGINKFADWSPEEQRSNG